MKKQLLLLACSLAFSAVLLAQEKPRFTIEVSTDSILLGNYFQVTFTLENAKGTDFAPPTFDGFTIVSGPNTSSSMSIVNGQVSQKVSYTYYLEPRDIGNYFIAPASIVTDDTILETQPLEVLVVPNPDGVQQKLQRERRSFGFDFFGTFPRMQPEFRKRPEQEKEQPSKKKKKRKVYKI